MPDKAAAQPDFDRLDEQHREVLDQLDKLEQQIEAAIEQNRTTA